jgi:hypothetical protein
MLRLARLEQYIAECIPKDDLKVPTADQEIRDELLIVDEGEIRLWSVMNRP